MGFCERWGEEAQRESEGAQRETGVGLASRFPRGEAKRGQIWARRAYIPRVRARSEFGAAVRGRNGMLEPGGRGDGHSRLESLLTRGRLFDTRFHVSLDFVKKTVIRFFFF